MHLIKKIIYSFFSIPSSGQGQPRVPYSSSPNLQQPPQLSTQQPQAVPLAAHTELPPVHMSSQLEQQILELNRQHAAAQSKLQQLLQQQHTVDNKVSY
jgi:hypothetical protein